MSFLITTKYKKSPLLQRWQAEFLCSVCCTIKQQRASERSLESKKQRVNFSARIGYMRSFHSPIHFPDRPRVSRILFQRWCHAWQDKNKIPPPSSLPSSLSPYSSSPPPSISLSPPPSALTVDLHIDSHGSCLTEDDYTVYADTHTHRLQINIAMGNDGSFQLIQSTRQPLETTHSLWTGLSLTGAIKAGGRTCITHTGLILSARTDPTVHHTHTHGHCCRYVCTYVRAPHVYMSAYRWDREATSLKMPCCSSEMSLPWRELKDEHSWGSETVKLKNSDSDRQRVSFRGPAHSLTHSGNASHKDKCTRTCECAWVCVSLQQSEGAQTTQRQRRDTAEWVVTEDPESKRKKKSRFVLMKDS